MRRRIFIAVIFLLAGAVVNVAVAWGCTTLTSFSSNNYRFDFRDVVPRKGDVAGFSHVLIMDESRGLAFGHDVVVRTSSRSFFVVPDEASYAASGSWTADVLAYSTRQQPVGTIAIRAGLPLRCLGARVIVRQPKDRPPLINIAPDIMQLSTTGQREYVHAWLLPKRLGFFQRRGVEFLPIRPIWPGFAVNTLLYATVLWLLICGPFLLRRFIRVKCGRCVKCGYLVGESAVCTECGKALPMSVGA